MKSDKIKDFAKDLYLQYNEDGSKTYSNSEIAILVAKKMRKKCGESTIRLWAKKGDWNKLNEQIKQQSILKSKDEKFTTEEKIIESKSNDLAQTYKHSKQLEKMAFDVAFKAYQKGEITFKDAMMALKYATDTQFRINEIPDPERKLSLNISKEEVKKINDILENEF